MSLRAAVVVISFLAASAVATSTNSDTVVRFRRHLADVPHGWMSEGDAMPHDTARVSFAVSHAAGAVDALLEEYWSRSDPTNSRMYGKWLSKDEIDALVPAHAGAKHAVMTWIAGVLPCATNGTCVVEHSDHIVVTAPVRAMWRMFPGMQWHRFRRAGQSLVAAVGECRLPRAVHSALRLVSGLSDFPPHRRALSQRGSDVASAGSSIPYASSCVDNLAVAVQLLTRCLAQVQSDERGPTSRMADVWRDARAAEASSRCLPGCHRVHEQWLVQQDLTGSVPRVPRPPGNEGLCDLLYADTWHQGHDVHTWHAMRGCRVVRWTTWWGVTPSRTAPGRSKRWTFSTSLAWRPMSVPMQCSMVSSPSG